MVVAVVVTVVVTVVGIPQGDMAPAWCPYLSSHPISQ